MIARNCKRETHPVTQSTPWLHNAAIQLQAVDLKARGSAPALDLKGIEM
jgi:hypothetical protein